MIIDFRVRPPYKSLTTFKHFQHSFCLPSEDPLARRPYSFLRKFTPSAATQSFPLFLEEMNRAGIAKVVVMGRVVDNDPKLRTDNKDVQELFTEYPDRFVGFGAVDPRNENAGAEAEKLLKAGFRGLCFDPGYIETYADDPVMFTLYDICSQHHALVSLAASSYIGPDLSYCDAVPYMRAARKFPKVNFIIQHAFWPMIAGGLGAATACPNIYLAPGVYLAVPGCPFAGEIVRAANSFLMNKILFSTSYPVRALDQSVEEWQAMPFDPQTKAQVFYHNARRLLEH